MKTILLVTIFLFSLPSLASSLIKDKSVTRTIDCFSGNFSSYDSWLGFMEKKYKSSPKGELQIKKSIANFKDNFTQDKFDYFKSSLICKNFSYTVDGNTVEGFLIMPKDVKEKIPVLIYNRGGNGDFGAVVFGAMMHDLFPISTSGFAIIGSQYRGTFIADSPIHDEFGGGDVKDVAALLDIIPSIDGVDEKRIGMFGASRGGMQTFLVLKESKNIKAVATISGVSDLLQELEFRPEMENVYKNIIPDYDKNKIVELSKRSVLNWVDKIPLDTPVLILHGESDEKVSVQNSIKLAKKLSQANMPHKLVIYKGDDHSLSKSKNEAHNEIIKWFKIYLQ